MCKKQSILIILQTKNFKGEKRVKMADILLVEDDLEYLNSISNILKEMGHNVVAVSDVIKGLEVFQNNKFDLVITDFLMDIMDGVRFISFIKNMDSNVKTIIFTGVPNVETEILALDVHVDYYLSKEIRKELFQKYVEKTLSSQPQKEQLYTTAQSDIRLFSTKEHIEVDVQSYVVKKFDVPVELTYKEMELLIYFLKHKKEAISREKIINALWECDHELVNYRVIDSHIKSLRRKLNIVSIQAIRGLGYKWNE